MKQEKNEASFDGLEKENQELRKKIQEYKSLDEELAAKRIYEKAKKQLISLISVGGLLITILGLIGFRSIVNYTKSIVEKKLESMGDQQINEIIKEQGKYQVSKIIEEKRNEFEGYIIEVARQQVEKVITASSPIREKEDQYKPIEVTHSQLDLTAQMTPVRN